MTLRPVEWVVFQPLSGDRMAIIRELRLDPLTDYYYRAVTPDADPTKRELIGYWSSAQEAEHAVYGEHEHETGQSLLGGGTKPSFPRIPQKPPPTPRHQPGMAAVPDRHGRR